MINQELLNKVKGITASGLPFMEGKEKIELGDGVVFTVKNYGFLEGDNGDFVVIANDTHYSFGGSIVTEAFHKLDMQLDENELNELLENGLPMKIGKKKSKNGRKYTVCEFFPKQEMQTR